MKLLFVCQADKISTYMGICHKPEQKPIQHTYSALSLLLVPGMQAAEQGLDVAKLMGGAQPLKEEEDMWFRQQNRSAPTACLLDDATCLLCFCSLQRTSGV